MLKKLNFIRGRVFVVGDIHGEFTLFERNLLNQFDFNPQCDNVLSVGDLVDRGPESHRALDFIESGWFHAVQGNHELMTIDAGGSDWHVSNGGQWYADLTPEQRIDFKRAFKALPLALEVTLPDGRRIGICHASIPGKQHQNEFHTVWGDDYMFRASTYAMRGEPDILWDRYQVGRAKKYAAMGYVNEGRSREFNVEGIDHVYMGHTPMKQPLTLGNCTWLDTGAFATGNLTIIEL